MKKGLATLERLLGTVPGEVFMQHESSLSRRHKKAKELVDAQFKDFALQKSAWVEFDEVEIEPENDFIYLLLELSSRTSLVESIFEDIRTSYSVPFTIVCSRISGKAKDTQMLDNFQTSYHVFYQALESLRDANACTQELLASLALYEPVHAALNESVAKGLVFAQNLITKTEEMAKSHQQGMDFVRYSKVA